MDGKLGENLDIESESCFITFYHILHLPSGIILLDYNCFRFFTLLLVHFLPGSGRWFPSIGLVASGACLWSVMAEQSST